jgi:hypothetical protein
MSDDESSNKVFQLRDQLLEHQQFFHNIYFASTHKTKQHLNLASKKQLILLVKVLHLIFSGEIPLKGEFFQKVKASKKLGFCVREFERKKDVNILLKKDRAEILSVLYKIKSVLKYLLSPLRENGEGESFD